MPKFLTLIIGAILVYLFFNDLNIIKQVALMSTGWTPVPNSWFIYVIIYLYLAFYLCALVTKSPLKIGILYTLAITAYILVVWKVLNFGTYWYATVIAASFGYFVALYEKTVDRILSRRALVFTALSALLFVTFYARENVSSPTIAYIFSVIWLQVQTFSLYVAVRTMGFLQNKWLNQLGILSLEIYLVHGFPLEAGLSLGLSDWSLWLFTIALSIPLAMLLNMIFDLLSRLTSRN